MDETKVIDMSEYVKNYDYRTERWQTLCWHGRTMVMMWQATGDSKYLERAQADLVRAKSIKEVGFVQPIAA